MSEDRQPKLEILFDVADANTHQPAQTTHNVPVHVEKEGGVVVEKISILRKYLKVVVHNAGNYVAKSCIAKARVIIPEADKGNDNFLRYPSTEQKLLMWDPLDREVSPITSINVDENERLYIAFADSDFKGIPTIQAPPRFASLATRNAITQLGREGLRIEDSFRDGDYEIEITISSERTSVKGIVKIHVDQDTINTTLTSVSTTT